MADGEEAAPGTVLFPKDAQRSIEILWKDPDKKTKPRSATISGKTSRWHAVYGISWGTYLSELERLNGGPLIVGGFGTDQPVSWQGGLLEELEPHGDGFVVLRLDYTPPKGIKLKLSAVNGDSNRPVMQRLNFRVFEITWEFPP